MNGMQQLKQILKETKRKTLPIENIEPLIKEIDKMYIQTSKRLREEVEMNKALRNVNAQLAIRLGMKQMSDKEIKSLFERSKRTNEKRPKQIR